MVPSILLSLALIVVLGVASQWLAWWLRLPSILLLLILGIVAGPVTLWIEPDSLFGDLLLPAVSLAVALIMYEGGLTLKVSELPAVGGVVRNLVTIGAAATWLVTAAAAHFVLGLSAALSALIAGILIVTGPTVIGPLLQHIRPTGAAGPALRWEGIVIDPIGAIVTVLIFEAILIGQTSGAAVHIVVAILKTVVLSGGLGLLAAWILTWLLERHWIADYLENAVSLMFVFAAFTLSHMIQHESGLLAVTVMGFVLANQKRADVQHIVEFKENLRVLLISSLFIILGARLKLSDLTSILAPGLIFVAILILVARPLSVWLATLGSGLGRPQKIFLAGMAPRGIVAAAVSSVFALRLEAENFEHADVIVPVTFLTIIATVAVYGLTSPWLARRLGVAEANPQGLLFAGAHAWARDIAALLQDRGYRVLLVDNNRDNVKAARLAGLSAHAGSILADHILDDIDLGGMGRLLAVTPNEWINVLAVHRFERVFGRANCYQLVPRRGDGKAERHKYLHGRWLFGEHAGYGDFARMLSQGFSAKATRLSEEFDYQAFRERYGDDAVGLFIIDQSRRLRIVTPDGTAGPQPGETIISFAREQEPEPTANASPADDNNSAERS